MQLVTRGRWYFFTRATRQWVCLFRTFKKTAPCEFIRGVRLQAGTETRPCFLPSSVSKNQFNKGSSGFLCGIGQLRRVGFKN
jgi:hypothetical protein